MSAEFTKIDNFVEESFLRKGFLRPSRFKCNWEVQPPSLPSYVAVKDDLMWYNIVSVVVPGITMESTTAPLRMGFGRRNIGKIRLTFLESSALNIRQFFHDWINLMVEHRSDEANYNRSFLDDVSAELSIRPITNSGSIAKKDYFKDVFPTDVMESTYDVGDDDNVGRSIVSLSYRYHYVE